MWYSSTLDTGYSANLPDPVLVASSSEFLGLPELLMHSQARSECWCRVNHGFGVYGFKVLAFRARASA